MSQVIPLPTPSVSPTEAASTSLSTPNATPASATTPEPPPAPQPSANQRLVIQESGELDVFVYSIVDRATGEVLVQMSRAEAADMASRKDSTVGQRAKRARRSVRPSQPG